jgi:hypothetical protein
METGRSVRDRAVRWIVDRIADDGCPPGSGRANGYYRVPWALATAGRADEGASVLRWIEQQALTDDGDLRPGPPQTAFTTTLASYPLSQIALGAWMLERYEVAQAIFARLESDYIDPTTGGVYAERPEVRRAGRQDLINTSQTGLAAVVAGRRDLAEGAYRWLAQLWDAQPELPRRLYTSWIPNGLLTQPDDYTTAWNVYTDFHKPHQQFYNPGMAAAFLARYAAMVGDGGPTALAREFIRLNEAGDELQFDYTENVQICKYGWGVTTLLEQGEADMLPAVLRMMSWYAASQRDDGSWTPSAFLVPKPDDADALGKTAEHLMHVSLSLRALSGWLAQDTSGR